MKSSSDNDDVSYPQTTNIAELVKLQNYHVVCFCSNPSVNITTNDCSVPYKCQNMNTIQRVVGTMQMWQSTEEHRQYSPLSQTIRSAFARSRKIEHCLPLQLESLFRKYRLKKLLWNYNFCSTRTRIEQLVKRMIRFV